MSHRRTVLSLGAGPNQVPIIQCAKAMGHRVIAVDRNPKAPGIDVADLTLCESTWDFGPILRRIQPPDAVLCRSAGPPVVTAAHLCAHWGIPRVPVDVAQALTRKSLAAEVAARAGFALPPPADAFPCIVRANLTRGGKKGVFFVAGEEDLDHLSAMAADASIDGTAVADGFVPGEDVSLLGLVLNGHYTSIGLVDEMNAPGIDGSIENVAYGYPSTYEGSEAHRELVDLTRRMARQCDMLRTPLSVNARIRPDGGVVFVEAHLDIGGDKLLEDHLPPGTMQRVVRGMVEGR